MSLPISEFTWNKLVEANKSAHKMGWAERGVFATGVGPEYEIGTKDSILYVGKSAGPLGSLVGSADDQKLSSEASTQWMITKRNKSAFWQFIDRIDFTRRKVAWTNVCKMDQLGGGRAPSGAFWQQISAINMQALSEEIAFLKPSTIVFATSEAYRRDIEKLISDLGFKPDRMEFDDGWTHQYKSPDGSIFMTRHPQGWPNMERDRVIKAVLDNMYN